MAPGVRDATLLKVIYGWGFGAGGGMLDVEDFSANTAAAELGRFGMLACATARHGRQPPRRRAVA